MLNDFTDLGVTPEILKAIDEMGFVEPTEVQARAIPPILNREDVIVMSKTGSGKTAVFGIPMLQMCPADAPGPQGLILTPTRELAVQIDSDIKRMAKYLPHKTAVVYGQHNMSVEEKNLRQGVSLVTGTPGRVYDHLRQGNLITKNIRFLVLDEADRMLDMGFLDQVVRIIRTLPKNRVTLLFSATIPPEVQRISRDFMNNPSMIEIESQTMTVDTIRQIYYRMERGEKNTQLNRILLTERPESCIIFCNTRLAVDRVVTFLTRKGYNAQGLHGDIPQARRTKTIEQFKKNEFHILVATDVAARGLHVEDLSLVINYDVPLEQDGYVHRIGRTGRAGKEGLAISMVTSDDIMSLYEIEEHIGAMIDEEELPDDDMLAECRELSAQWAAANSVKSVPQSEKVSGDDSKPKRKRGKSDRKASPENELLPRADARPSAGADRAARPASVSSASNERFSGGETRPAFGNAPKTQSRGTESVQKTSSKPLANPRDAEPAENLQTARRPHMRIIGEPAESASSGASSSARPVSSGASFSSSQKPAVKGAHAPAAARPTETTRMPAAISEPEAQKKEDPNEKRTDKKPVLPSFISRLLKKK